MKVTGTDRTSTTDNRRSIEIIPQREIMHEEVSARNLKDQNHSQQYIKVASLWLSFQEIIASLGYLFNGIIENHF